MGWRTRVPKEVRPTLRGPTSGWERVRRTLRRSSPQDIPMQLTAVLRKMLLCAGMVAAACQMTATCASTDQPEPELLSFEVVADYPHDLNAFTQGLHYENVCEEGNQQCQGIFWESTGLNGQSSIRKVDVTSGKVLAKTMLDYRHFGEGLTKLDGVLFQLTWLTNHLLLYDTNLQQVDEKRTPLRDGWGLATDGKELIATDGSEMLFFIDPHSMDLLRMVNVTDQGQPVNALNEVEWVDGEVWANVWMSDCIARIDPHTGYVKSWVLMHGLKQQMLRSGHVPRAHHMDVLNGIAYDPERQRIFVTGKLWPRMYEIKITPPKANVTNEKLQARKRSCYQGKPHFF